MGCSLVTQMADTFSRKYTEDNAPEKGAIDFHWQNFSEGLFYFFNVAGQTTEVQPTNLKLAIEYHFNGDRNRANNLRLPLPCSSLRAKSRNQTDGFFT